MNTDRELENNMSEPNQVESHRLLQLLRTELRFFDAEGYGRTFRGQWRPTLLLRDSPACINYHDTGRQNPCTDCPLFALVVPDKKDSLIPCHYIPLNKGGVTIADLYKQGSQTSLDRLYRNWLQDTTKKTTTSS
ncbi:MAG: hypothetical protein JWN42_3072 [Candidatus Angelobacter sp.]|jgi:hypothetical protein|nr:hypothetical protein [Candidatus Angelobacter sp.]